MLIIGNGESRKNINIDKIKDIKIGCNAIYRDYTVDYISACDRRVLKELIQNNVTTPTYTRSEWLCHFRSQSFIKYPELPYKGKSRQDIPFQWGSGAYATLLGAIINSDDNHLIGFDLWGKGENFKFQNNIYKDTANYQVSTYRAVDPSYWIYQIGKVIENFPNQKFVIYNVEGWEMPTQWKFPNSTLDIIDNVYYNVN